MVDLTKLLSDKVGFNFEIKLVKDGNFGGFDVNTGEWTGMIREVMDHVGHQLGCLVVFIFNL